MIACYINVAYIGDASNVRNQPGGCPKVLASLIRAGQYDPLKAASGSTEELKSVCTEVGLTVPSNATRVSLHELLIN